MPRRVAACVLAFAIALPVALTAQRAKEPRRPRLRAGSDTNSARVYYDFALEQLRPSPDQAADALYWATRIEPTWADAYYARRIALLLSDNRRLLRYWSGDRRTMESDEIRRIDSLFYQALTLNPFVSQRLDRQIFEAVADEVSHEAAGGSMSEVEVRYEIDRMMANAYVKFGEPGYYRLIAITDPGVTAATKAFDREGELLGTAGRP